MHVISMVVILLSVNYVFPRQSDYCSADDDDPYLNMATKTAYDFIRGRQGDIQSVPNCQPLQIWMLARYGTRYPEKKNTMKLLELKNMRDQIVRNHETRRSGKLCRSDLDNLKQWTPHQNMTIDMSQQLTPQGEEDNILLARRLKSHFPELLQPKKYDITSQNYIFKSVKNDRSINSMKAFMEGLFGSKYAVDTISPNEDDTLLQPYKNCTKWENGDETDPPTLAEHNKFKNSEEFKNLIYNVSRRIGFQYDLSSDVLLSMYELCRFEKSWILNNLSPWCAVFSKDELKILEYYEDLDYYYRAGNGRKVNKLIGCFPLQDMVNNFRSLERGDTEGKPKGIFYFSNSKTIISFLSTMDIMPNQNPLTSDNYKDNIKRQWRTSKIDPFSSNIVAVFYRCKEEKESPNKVMFYLQEKPLLYEGCQVGLCDWEYLKNKFGSIANECSIDACDNKNIAVLYKTSTVMIMSFVVLLLIKH